ncbi:hypothetical protein Hte_010564 [Hypoxylon texense]
MLPFSYFKCPHDWEAIDERTAPIFIACAKISPRAILAVLNAIKSRAGQPDPSWRMADRWPMADSAARLISSGAKAVAKVTLDATHHVRRTAQRADMRNLTIRPRGVYRPVDWEPVTTAISDFARNYATEEAPDQLETLQTILRVQNNEEAAAALTAAAADVVGAIACLVNDHIASVAPSTASIESVEEVVLAAAYAAAKVSKEFASSVPYLDRSLLYEDTELAVRSVEHELYSSPLSILRSDTSLETLRFRLEAYEVHMLLKR